MKWIVSLLALGLLECDHPVAEFRRGGPTADQIAAIEAKVVMPPEASPIDRYLRTYFPENGRIIGQYNLGEQKGVRGVPERDQFISTEAVAW